MLRANIYNHTAELPALPEDNFFHSAQLMKILELTPRQRPLMAVVYDDDGNVVAHMLASIRYRSSWIPPFLYISVHILGEGVYSSFDDETFALMIDAVKHHLNNKALYFEVSHLSDKMRGYRTMRQAGFFPVKWMSIHNSLHSRTPEERISERQMSRIQNAMARGVETHEATTELEFKAFFKLLHHHHWLKPRRFIPHDKLFLAMQQGGYSKIYITTYRGHVIGCAVVVFSNGDAYLWHSASRRKSYAPLHPAAVTYWNTIKAVHSEGYQHIRFMDVGLPFRRNPHREFILSFGGKEVSTYRWFYISIRWVNALASWLWRE